MPSLDWSHETAIRTLYQEANKEPLDGQKAVIHVMLNRVLDGRWGQTLGSVCHSHWQFSAWWATDGADLSLLRRSCDLTDDDPALVKLRLTFLATETEPDFTGSATHYYAESIPEPRWVVGGAGVPPATFCGKWGSQLFFKGVR